MTKRSSCGYQLAGIKRNDRGGNSFGQKRNRDRYNSSSSGYQGSTTTTGYQHRLCFNCDRPDQYKYKCRQPKNEEKVMQKANEMSKKFDFKSGVSKVNFNDYL